MQSGERYHLQIKVGDEEQTRGPFPSEESAQAYGNGWRAGLMDHGDVVREELLLLMPGRVK